MRTYIDIRGRFKIEIPDHWNCREEDKSNGNPVSFMFGDDSDDCFQISCIPNSKGRVPETLSGQVFSENKYLEFPVTFLRRNISMDDMGMTVFEARVEDYFILALHTASNKEADDKVVQEHLSQVAQSLETLAVVNPSSWADFAASARFNRFMVSMFASIDLTNKAQEKGSSIELVILYGNRIDAQLRLALILQEQLRDATNKIDVGLIFQGEKDEPIFEKAIYRRARDSGILDESLFERLMTLYLSRNKVVHRYIISDLKTNDIIKLVVDYMDIHEILGNKLSALEQEQFKKNIGIYGDGNDPKDPISTGRLKGLITELHEKHANTQIIKEMTIKVPPDDISLRSQTDSGE